MLNLHREVHELLNENSRTFDHFQYTVPSAQSYPYQWFWDSCFHSIIWTHFDFRRAQAELDSLVFRQQKNGFIGHIIYWQPGEILNIDWGIPHTSSLLQPPILAYSVWRVYEKSNDKEWLEDIYPKLALFYNHIIRERNIRKKNLYGLVNPDESGEDSAPKFDFNMGLPPKHEPEENTKRRYALFEKHKECKYKAYCTSQYFWVEDLSFNTYIVWNLEILSDIAYILGNKKDSNTWRKHALRTKESMRTHMFVNGKYVSIGGVNGDYIFSNGWDQFLPLIAGLYSQSEAYCLIKNSLLNKKHFWLKYGIPTVSKNDPAYEPDEPTWGEAWQHPDWRGAVWMAPHWFIYHGLYRYGFKKEAEYIKKISLKLIENNGFRENYHPETGIGMGAKGFTWGGLTVDMKPTDTYKSKS